MKGWRFVGAWSRSVVVCLARVDIYFGAYGSERKGTLLCHQMTSVQSGSVDSLGVGTRGVGG